MGCWPVSWKTEHLTIIPKNANPADLSECRNISCTSAFSKILEGQVLVKLRRELEADLSQYGGVPKCGVEHLLLDLWEDILEGMEGGDKALSCWGSTTRKPSIGWTMVSVLMSLGGLGLQMAAWH